MYHLCLILTAMKPKSKIYIPKIVKPDDERRGIFQSTSQSKDNINATNIEDGMQHPNPAECKELRTESMNSVKEGGLPALHSDFANLVC
jgi:hypothetical protein